MKKAIDHIAAVPWAIEPAWLQTLQDIAGRDLSDFEAVEKKRADRLARSEKAGIRDGVAVLDISGPIFRHANLFTEISGATSIETLGRDLNAALEDPNVKSILLNVDSPGGMVSGTNEFAAMVKEADKPVTAYVGNLAASAAYWIASAADEIVIDPTGQLGSIGVVQTRVDDSKQQSARGIESIEIVSSQSPHKRPDIKSDEGRAEIQRHVDDLADVFVAVVAENRGTTPEKVISDFGAGGMLIGKKAVAAGMADRLGNFEEVLAGLAGDDRGFAQKGPAAITTVKQETDFMNDKVEKTEVTDNNPAPTITADHITASYPEIASHFQNIGATAERTRILAIEEAALPGHDALVATLKADGATSAGDAALQIMAAEKGKLSNRLAAQKSAGKLTDKIKSSATSTGEEDVLLPASASVDDRAKETWDKDAKLRAEFGAFSTYLAYAKAQDSGQVNIKTG